VPAPGLEVTVDPSLDPALECWVVVFGRLDVFDGLFCALAELRIVNDQDELIRSQLDAVLVFDLEQHLQEGLGVLRGRVCRHEPRSSALVVVRSVGDRKFRGRYFTSWRHFKVLSSSRAVSPAP
jgi:hypothetical protein